MHYGDHIYCAFHANNIANPVVPSYAYVDAEVWDDFPIWTQALEAEMVPHAQLGTWDLLDLPLGHDAIGSH